MNSDKKKLAVWVFALCSGLTGCMANTAGSDQSVSLPVVVVWQSSQCNVTSAQIRQIETPAEWQSVYALSRSAIGNEVLNPPTLDFSNHTYSLVAMGNKPNPGYGLQVNGDHAAYSHGILTLPVAEATPAPDKMYAQMIVSPCVLLATPKLDNIVETKLK